MSALVLTLVVLAAAVWPGRAAPVRWQDAPPDRGVTPTTTSLTVDEVADASMLLALALRSGRGLTDALDEVASVAEPGAAEDLTRVAAALRWGRSMEDAWGYAREVWRPTATAFVISDAVGAPSAEVLLDAATALRETESRRLEQAGGTAAVMLVLPLGLCFLPAFIATAVIPLVAVLVGTQLS